jgi:formimidoylglutamate deiminase
MMMRIFAEQALLPEGWASNAAVSVSSGSISRIEIGAAAASGDVRVKALMPALSNVHSHTFQRGMAGMAETRGAAMDSFWTWREMMYRFIDHLTPSQIEAIAAMAFVEMQEAGFAAVGEFHYVHHQPGGAPYANPAELSERIFAAAKDTGIGLTHLPVLYAFGGAGEQPLRGGQLRFGSDLDGFEVLFEATARSAKGMADDCRIGIAPHSLRAVNPQMLRDLVSNHGAGPVHMHIAEQVLEVDDVKAWLGARPVEWLLANMPVDERWCLIHATHMTDAETRGVAKSRAVIGLCPVTEANLGDGTFNGRGYLKADGAFGIGTDSNVRISVREELSTLEYSQRLKHRERNVLPGGPGSTGEGLYLLAAAGGARALGRNSGAIAVGKLADLVAIDASHPALCALKPDQLLDGWMFAAPDGVVADVWSAGRHSVRDGRHVRRDEVVTHYRKAMHDLVTKF